MDTMRMHDAWELRCTYVSMHVPCMSMLIFIRACTQPADSAGLFWRLIFPLLQLATLIALLALCAYMTSQPASHDRSDTTWNPLRRQMTREIKGDKKW